MNEEIRRCVGKYEESQTLSTFDCVTCHPKRNQCALYISKSPHGEKLKYVHLFLLCV